MVAAAAFVAAGSVRAAVITTYTNLATWQTVAGSPIVLEDFTDATLQPGVTITFGTNSPAGSISGGAYHDVAVSQFNDAKNPKLNFAPSTTAFGADWDLTQFPADGVVIAVHSVGGGALFDFGGFLSGTFSGFFGIVSDTAFDQIRFDSPGTGVQSFDMDNLRFKGTGDGGGGTAPEPGTLALIALAMLGLSAARVRRR